MTHRWIDFPKRFLTFILGVPALVLFVMYGPLSLLSVVTGALCGVAASEFTHLSGVGRGRFGRALVSVAASMMPPGAFLYGRSDSFPTMDKALGIAGTGVVCLLIIDLIYDGSHVWRKRPIVNLVLAVVYCGALPAFVILLHGRWERGWVWVLVVLAVTWGNDAGAYLTGRAFGRHLLAAKLSPRKTVEGAIGGLVVGVSISAAIAPMFGSDINLTAISALALMAATLSQVGDLWESRLKRFAGVADSGVILPGGGALDIVDGLCFSAPTLFLGLALQNW